MYRLYGLCVVLYIFYCTIYCTNPAFGCQILINFLSCLVLMVMFRLLCIAEISSHIRVTGYKTRELKYKNMAHWLLYPVVIRQETACRFSFIYLFMHLCIIVSYTKYKINRKTYTENGKK